jgi:hypothetical protein
MSNSINQEIIENLFWEVCEEVAAKYPHLDEYEVETLATPITKDRFYDLCQ